MALILSYNEDDLTLNSWVMREYVNDKKFILGGLWRTRHCCSTETPTFVMNNRNKGNEICKSAVGQPDLKAIT
jgi:hypothetical protein